MAFGSGEVPDLGAPGGQHDADLEELRPLSLLDEDAGFHPPVAGGRFLAAVDGEAFGGCSPER